MASSLPPSTTITVPSQDLDDDLQVETHEVDSIKKECLKAYKAGIPFHYSYIVNLDRLCVLRELTFGYYWIPVCAKSRVDDLIQHGQIIDILPPLVPGPGPGPSSSFSTSTTPTSIPAPVPAPPIPTPSQSRLPFAVASPPSSSNSDTNTIANNNTSITHNLSSSSSSSTSSMAMVDMESGVTEVGRNGIAVTANIPSPRAISADHPFTHSRSSHTSTPMDLDLLANAAAEALPSSFPHPQPRTDMDTLGVEDQVDDLTSVLTSTPARKRRRTMSPPPPPPPLLIRHSRRRPPIPDTTIIASVDSTDSLTTTRRQISRPAGITDEGDQEHAQLRPRPRPRPRLRTRTRSPLRSSVAPSTTTITTTTPSVSTIRAVGNLRSDISSTTHAPPSSMMSVGGFERGMAIADRAVDGMDDFDYHNGDNDNDDDDGMTSISRRGHRPSHELGRSISAWRGREGDGKEHQSDAEVEAENQTVKFRPQPVHDPASSFLGYSVQTPCSNCVNKGAICLTQVSVCPIKCRECTKYNRKNCELLTKVKYNLASIERELPGDFENLYQTAFDDSIRLIRAIQSGRRSVIRDELSALWEHLSSRIRLVATKAVETTIIASRLANSSVSSSSALGPMMKADDMLMRTRGKTRLTIMLSGDDWWLAGNDRLMEISDGEGVDV